MMRIQAGFTLIELVLVLVLVGLLGSAVLLRPVQWRPDAWQVAYERDRQCRQLAQESGGGALHLYADACVWMREGRELARWPWPDEISCSDMDGRELSTIFFNAQGCSPDYRLVVHDDPDQAQVVSGLSGLRLPEGAWLRLRDAVLADAQP